MHVPRPRALQHRLVYTLERRHGLALSLVQRVGNDGTVAKLHLAMRLLLEAERVLHPGFVVSLGEVLAGMCTAGLLASSCRGGSLGARYPCQLPL